MAGTSRRPVATGLPVAAAAGALMLALAGCGSATTKASSASARSGSPATAGTSTSGGSSAPASGSPTAPSAGQLASERSRGTQALLRLSDLPAGWTATPAERRKRGGSLDARLAACLHVSAALVKADPTEVRSPTFLKAGESMTNGVILRSTPRVAEEHVAVYSMRGTPRCMSTALTGTLARELGSLPPSVSLAPAQVKRASLPSEGDRSLAYSFTLPITVGARRVPIYIDAVVVRVGRATSALVFSGTGRRVPAATEVRMTALTANRLRAAVGEA
jgi:hypothetical protein